MSLAMTVWRERLFEMYALFCVNIMALFGRVLWCTDRRVPEILRGYDVVCSDGSRIPFNGVLAGVCYEGRGTVRNCGV